MLLRRLQYAGARRSGWDLIYREGATRTEHDLLGEREVPADARYFAVVSFDDSSNRSEISNTARVEQ